MQFDLKTKIGGGFAVLLVLFALAGGLSILNLRVQQATVHEIVENDMPMVEVLNTTAATLQLYRRAEKDMLLTIGVPDKQRAYHARLKSLSSEMRVLLGQLDKATAANEDLGKEARTLPAKALAGFEKYDAMLMPLAERLVAEGGLDVAQANALLTKEKDSVHGAEQALVQLQKAGTEMFVGNQKTMAALAGKTELTLLASVLCALLAGGIMAWLTVRSIVLPLRRIMDLAGAVAKGDLNARADGVFAAEMGELKASIEAMLAELKAKIAEADAGLARAEDEAARARVAVAEAEEAKKRADAARAEGMLQAAGTLEQVAGAVAGASEELAAQVEQSSRGTELQSGRAAETATAMEEMNATVLEVAKSAGQAAESAEQARSKAEEGSRLVIQVVEGIGAMQTVSASLREDMRGLGKQAEDIGRVLGVISDIADQTNLLALNAAIEAARAGDAGRGFAVVADEVRKLAEKTMTATREVGEAIRGIQEGTRRNLDGVERAAGMVEQATAMARRSGDALSEIVGLVESSTDQVRAIATASEEQSAASEEINRSVEDINRLAGENASAMRDAGQAVQELARQVQALRRLMDQLKRGG